MGLFDDIRCEYRLPLPEDQGELAGKDWSKQGFQTKDLGEGMGGYCIRADGTLWLVGARWLQGELGEPNFQNHFFGTIHFYDTIRCQKHDYWVEWQATFTKGKLNELRLEEWRLDDNTERLQQEADFAASRERTERFIKTLIGRFLYPPYAWLVGLLFGAGVGSGAGKLAEWLHKVQRLAWRLEHYLKPHGDPIRAERRRKKFKDAL
jgi:hypothetical protein